MEKQNHKDDITVKHIADARRKSEGEDSPDGIEYKKTNKSTANAEALLLLFEEAPGNFGFSLDNYSSFGNVDLSKASAMLEGLDYTIEDIEFICPLIAYSYKKKCYASKNLNFLREKDLKEAIGIFLSAAINKIIKKTDTVNIYLLGIEVDYLGSYLPCGNLIIHGNVGKMTGTCMENGIIIIEGNAGTNTGHQMKNGIIIIEGNAGINTGCFMSEGTIIVGGNVGDFTGELSYGGKIDVYGKITTVWGIGQDARAAIFCKGKRVNNQ